MDNLYYLVFSEIVQMVLFKIVPVCRYEYCRRTYSDCGQIIAGVGHRYVWRVGVHQIMTVNTVNNS